MLRYKVVKPAKGEGFDVTPTNNGRFVHYANFAVHVMVIHSVVFSVSLLGNPSSSRRDNRLSSLQGLAGLPNLRELRLDINHLTSLRELRSLPSLVELSANTNHIQELPDGFAAGLMLHGVLPPDHIKAPSSLAGSAVAYGGLQKLELYHNRIASVHPRALEGLVSLTHLDLGRNQLKSLDGRGMEWCPALSTLVLSQNLLREPPSPLRLPLLKELWLSGNRISTLGTWNMKSPPAPAFSSFISQSQGQPSPEVTPWSITGREAPRENQNSTPWNRQENQQEGNENSIGRDLNRQKKSSTGSELEREKNKSIGWDGGSKVHRGYVWLPSLEMLHLQDNSLETFGGRRSLAGCPLLHSFDASFNSLRVPAELGVCLSACSELEEVRLHDNPASECAEYADAIALNCPKVRTTYINIVPAWNHPMGVVGAETTGRKSVLIARIEGQHT